VTNNCGQETALLSVETKDFWVNICGEETDPRLYVGVNKKTGKAIRLPLKGQNNGIYVAENKGVKNILNYCRSILYKISEISQRNMNWKPLYIITSLALTATLASCNQSGGKNQIADNATSSEESSASHSDIGSSPESETQAETGTSKSCTTR
jgi:hypothetical protein